MILPSIFSSAVRSKTRMSAILLSLLLVLIAAVVLTLYLSGAASSTMGNEMSCENGQTQVVRQTTHLHVLTIAQGCTLAAPVGSSLTLTVNGVETGQLLTRTGGTQTKSAPGTYRGNIALTVTQANPVPWQSLTFPFRQSLYVDSSGVVSARSVLASVIGSQVTNAEAKNIKISSNSEAFNGVYVTNANYTLEKPAIAFNGNGRCDFVGYGAAIVGTGTKTRLVVDGANISNRGAVRSGIIAEGGANVIVKNSTIQTLNGELPSDYQPTVYPLYMESAPWMLGISGNVRATNVLGTDTKATYINSSVASEDWGALSTDSGSNDILTAIDSKATNLGNSGYGTYADGNPTEWLLGSEFDVGTYATILTSGTVHYGDSTHAAISQLNSTLGLNLTPQEIAALLVRHTIINSRRFGDMWHSGAATVDVTGGTVINTKETTFLDKAEPIVINVDGSQGARLNPNNGILLQLMESDDPGPIAVNGTVLNEGVYHEPTSQPTRVSSFDVTAVHSTDAIATFTDMTLKGDFYNGMRGGSTSNGATGNPGAASGPASPGGENMVLTFNNSRIEGVISASQTRHHVSTITSAQYQQLGEVTNTAHSIINNGVIVHLNSGSRWTVTGTSYLSKLVVATNAAITAPDGHSVTLMVNGVPTIIVPGSTYTGSIVLTVH